MDYCHFAFSYTYDLIQLRRGFNWKNVSVCQNTGRNSTICNDISDFFSFLCFFLPLCTRIGMTRFGSTNWGFAIKTWLMFLLATN